MRFSLVAAVLAFAASAAFGAPSPPTLVYSIQRQLPPVARVNETWTFSLLADTFNSSSGDPVTLSCRNLPTWATFDANTWMFSGTPTTGDEGSHWVTVQANTTGVARGARDGFRLRVVNNPAPTVGLALSSQFPTSVLSSGGAFYYGDNLIRVPPHWSFSLGFQQYTFQDPWYSRVYYTAYEEGTISLPSWIEFDNRTVTFNGIAPGTRGETTIILKGSEYYGYGDVEQVFKIVVGWHVLDLAEPLPALNATAGAPINYTLPLSNLKLDNSTIAPVNLTSVAVNLAEFPTLSYDAATRTIQGTLAAAPLPASAIAVIFTDVFNNTVAANVTVNLLASAFAATSLPALSVTPGVPFSTDLSAYATSTTAVYSAAFAPAAAGSWMSFNPQTKVLSGTPPADLPFNNLVVTFSATDSVTRATSQATMDVAILPATSATSTGAGAGGATTSGATGPSATGGVLQENSYHLSNNAKLAIGLSVGIVGGLALLALIMACCRRHMSDERKLRRDQSTLIFDDATIAAAAAKTSPFEMEKSPNETIIAAPYDKEKPSGWSSPMSNDTTVRDPTPRLISPLIGPSSPIPGGPPSPRLPPAAAVAAAAAVPLEPKRAGLMNMFAGLGGGKMKKDESQHSLGVPGSGTHGSLFGLGLGGEREDEEHDSQNFVVVTDDGRGTYVPRAGPSSEGSSRGARDRDGESDISRSSWGSRGSSSLFYSEGSQSQPNNNASQPLSGLGSSSSSSGRQLGPANVAARRAAPSVPRRRADFGPTPTMRQHPAGSSSTSMSEDSSPSEQGGIRLVERGPGSDSASMSSGTEESWVVQPWENRPDHLPRVAAEAHAEGSRIRPPMVQQRTPSHNSDAERRYSVKAAVRSSTTSPTPTSSSQSSSLRSALADADEESLYGSSEERLRDTQLFAMPHPPPRGGKPATAPIYYNATSQGGTPVSGRSPVPSAQEKFATPVGTPDMRYVGSVVSAQDDDDDEDRDALRFVTH